MNGYSTKETVLELSKDEYEKLSQEFSARYATDVADYVAIAIKQEIDKSVEERINALFDEDHRRPDSTEVNLVDLFNDVFPKE